MFTPHVLIPLILNRRRVYRLPLVRLAATGTDVLYLSIGNQIKHSTVASQFCRDELVRVEINLHTKHIVDTLPCIGVSDSCLVADSVLACNTYTFQGFHSLRLCINPLYTCCPACANSLLHNRLWS